MAGAETKFKSCRDVRGPAEWLLSLGEARRERPSEDLDGGARIAEEMSNYLAPIDANGDKLGRRLCQTPSAESTMVSIASLETFTEEAPGSGSSAAGTVGNKGVLVAAWARVAGASAPEDAYPAIQALERLAEDPLGIAEAEARSHLMLPIFHGQITKSQFFCLVAALRGTLPLKAAVAFDTICAKGVSIPLAKFSQVASLLIADQDLLKRFVGELDSDGSGEITAERFQSFLPAGHQAHPRSYSVQVRNAVGQAVGRRYFQSRQSEAIRVPAAAPSTADSRSASPSGTSPLQMQIGFFRLLQGAAYRCFRASYSANSETHLRASSLPYTITNFTKFVRAAVDLYIGLGILDDRCISEAELLADSVEKEFADLQTRMANWDIVEKTLEMNAVETEIETEQVDLDSDHHLFAALVEFILRLGISNHDPYDVTNDDLAHMEINRLRFRDELHENGPKTVVEINPKGSNAFLRSWQRVIVDDTDTLYEGAIMPTAFWYEAFMPQLLRVCSAMTNDELTAIDRETDADLDAWFRATDSTDGFGAFAKDVMGNFLTLSRKVKQEIKQAWRLTQHYLNGVQKRREREEAGRNDGYLSEYVAFVDVYLNRDDVKQAQMRLSFPYFIGPATWRFMHTCAEIIHARNDQEPSLENFKAFFRALATVYPCPYCRFHLNRYVVRNKELDKYPIEYIFLGASRAGEFSEVSLDDKLSTIDSSEKLRLFLWKLHNTVSSSIARSEAWFHRDESAYYTTRYWPSLESELARAKILNEPVLEAARIARIYGVMKPAARLAIFRDELQIAILGKDENVLKPIWERYPMIVEALETAVVANKFLDEAYAYDPNESLAAPHFTPEEESLARSGFYIEA